MAEKDKKDEQTLMVAILKLIVIGDISVGKTNIIARYVTNDYAPEYVSTIGVGLKTNTYYYKDIKVKEQIWDTAGSEKYQSISGVYYKGAHGAFLVYDILRKESFENLKKWMQILKQNTTDDLEIVILGNKVDLDYKREVSFEEASNYAQENCK